MDTHPYTTVVIRRATEADAPALEELAQLEGGRRIGGEDVLIAEVDGEAQAAVRVRDDIAISDPFRPTQELVDLLRTRAAMMRDGQCRSRTHASSSAVARRLLHLVHRRHAYVP